MFDPAKRLLARKLSTAEAARQLGVSSATVKRWADRGVIRAVRTAGGHRRFEESELVRVAGTAPAEDDALTAWVKMLLEDPDQAVAAALRVERERLGAWYRVADELRPVVQGLDPAGERQVGQSPAAVRLTRALARWAGSLPPRPDAPRALLSAPEGQGSLLGLSLVELCMRERGWNAICDGRAARGELVAAEVERGGATAVALAATDGCPPELLRRELDVLVPVCRRRGVALVAAGQAPWPEPLPYARIERTFSGLHAWMVEFERCGGGAAA